jgi:hypothetical protein
LNYQPSEIPIWAGKTEVFFQCPESVLDGDAAYWITLERWCRLMEPSRFLDFPAVDCDAINAIQALEKES